MSSGSGCDAEAVMEVVTAYEDLGIRCLPVQTDGCPFPGDRREASAPWDAEKRAALFQRRLSADTAFLIAGVPGQLAVLAVDDPAAFDAGIRGLSYFQVDGAARRFGGLLQTRT